METTCYKFPKSSRLSSITSVNECFENGKIIRDKSIKGFFIRNAAGSCKVMITVPKRLHRKAVTRNLLKRRMREAYRLNAGILKGKASANIVLIYSSEEILPYIEIKKNIANVLGKIGKLLEADSGSAVPAAD